MIETIKLWKILNDIKVRRQQKNEHFYGQAERKCWPPPPYGQLFVIFLFTCDLILCLFM